MLPFLSLDSASFVPGVYQLPLSLEGVSAAALATAVSASETGWHITILDGTDLHDKATLLTAVGEAFAFPAYFGHNWDALEEMLADLSWLPAAGYVILLEGFEQLAHSDPANWHTLLSIWQETTAVWANDRPMLVFVRGEAGADLPLFTLATN